MFSENNENINEEKNDEVMDTVVTEEYGAEQIQVLPWQSAPRPKALISSSYSADHPPAPAPHPGQPAEVEHHGIRRAGLHIL